MHISKLSLVNYRNFLNAKMVFKEGINTIVGENGSGKTNLFRAIRLLLDDWMMRSAYRMNEQDFCRALQDPRGHWIIISIEFEKISHEEAIQSLFVHGLGVADGEMVDKATYNLIFRPKVDIRQSLSKLDDGDKDGLKAILRTIKIEDYEVIFTGKSAADFNCQETYKRIVGDFENVVFSDEVEPPEIGLQIPKMLCVSKEVSFTFIQALRDVVAEFHNNRTNPLLSLLKNKSGDIDPNVFQPIADMVNQLNDSIETLEDVKDIRNDIEKTIKEAVGETYSPTSLSIKSGLSDEADKLFQELKLFVGESEEDYEGAIHELSLGGANLIYLTLKLLEFKYQSDQETCANFLVVEEPEAHIHTHIQKTLFDKLDFPNTQIIYSTHSTQISEVSNVNNINVLGKSDGYCEVYQPVTGLTPIQSRNVQRYLDAIRSNLLFAKSIILVEGDAEEILIPVLIKQVLGVSLDELGISLINIRSTGFENVAILFHDNRIRKKCAILTDLDVSIIDTEIEDDDPEKEFKRKCLRSQKSGKTRKVRLDAFSNNNDWVSVYYAQHTFEVDFILGGINRDEAKSTVDVVYTDNATIEHAKEDLNSDEVAIYGKRILTMANNMGKGWFAIQLSHSINCHTHIPDYILKAIIETSPSFNNKIWADVITHRLSCVEHENFDLNTIIGELKQFKMGNIEVDALLVVLPEDQIFSFLEHV